MKYTVIYTTNGTTKSEHYTNINAAATAAERTNGIILNYKGGKQ